MYDYIPMDDPAIVEYIYRFGPDGMVALRKRLALVTEMLNYKKLGTNDVCRYRQKLARREGISATRISQYEKAFKEHGWKGLLFATKRSDAGYHRSLCLKAQHMILKLRQEYPLSSPALLQCFQRALKEEHPPPCPECIYNAESRFHADFSARWAEINIDFPVCTQEKKGLVIPKHPSTINRFLANIPEYFVVLFDLDNQ